MRRDFGGRAPCVCQRGARPASCVGSVCALLEWALALFWAMMGFLVARPVGPSDSKSDTSCVEFNVSGFLRTADNKTRFNISFKIHVKCV